jgi:hypothetical protein
MSAGLRASVWAGLRTADHALGSASDQGSLRSVRDFARKEWPLRAVPEQGTIQLRPQDTAGIPDDELLDLVRAALQA